MLKSKDSNYELSTGNREFILPIVVPLLITALVYLAAYFYELGFMKYFKLDVSSVRIHSESLVVGFLFFIGALVGVTQLFHMLWKAVGSKSVRLFRMCISFIIASGFAYLAFVLGSGGIISSIFLGIGIASAIYGIGGQLLNAIAQKEPTRMSVDRLLTLLSHIAYFGFIVAISLGALAFFAGSERARAEKSFKIFNHRNSQYIVIREAGDLVIAKEYKNASSLKKTTPVLYINQHQANIVFSYIDP